MDKIPNIFVYFQIKFVIFVNSVKLEKLCKISYIPIPIDIFDFFIPKISFKKF